MKKRCFDSNAISLSNSESERERVNTSTLTFILTQKVTVYDEVGHSNICMINSKKFEVPAMLYCQENENQEQKLHNHSRLFLALKHEMDLPRAFL